MKRVYLDHNATAPLRHECLDIVSEWGNGSAVHGRGRHVRGIIESCRKKIADFLGVSQRGIIFTSGATEANNMLLKGYPGPVITSLLEHPSMLKARSDAHLVPIQSNGIIDLTQLEEALQKHPEALVSVIVAHNETGVIQPIEDAAALAHQYGGFFHTDAVQGFGRTQVNFQSCDYITLSGHKVGSFAGIGILYANQNAPLSSLLSGGGQEYGTRAGTENFIGIRSMALAMELAQQDPWEKIAEWRNELEAELMLKTGTINVVPPNVTRLPNTMLVSYPKITSSTTVMKLDLAGFEVSAGSACHSGKVRTTGTLEAMGVAPEVINSTIRISIPYNAQHDDLKALVEAWKTIDH